MFAARGLQGRFVGEAIPSEHLRGVYLLQPEPHSHLLPAAGTELRVPGCEHAHCPPLRSPSRLLPACSMVSGEPESSWPRALLPGGEAVTVSHTSALLTRTFVVVDIALVSAVWTRLNASRDLAPQGDLGLRMPGLQLWGKLTP